MPGDGAGRCRSCVGPVPGGAGRCRSCAGPVGPVPGGAGPVGPVSVCAGPVGPVSACAGPVPVLSVSCYNIKKRPGAMPGQFQKMLAGIER